MKKRLAAKLYWFQRCARNRWEDETARIISALIARAAAMNPIL